jgi:iron complex outermembrane recepter protein
MKKLTFNFIFSKKGPLSIKTFGTAFLLFLTSILSAQKISGTVTDASGKAQEFASVMLMQSKDSTLTKGAITDADGKFDIENAAAGTYFLNVSVVGFKPFLSKSFEFDGKMDVLTDKISLKTMDTELGQVTIVSRKPVVEVKADRIVFNVEASPTAQGLNALELLRKSPGVNVDKDENVNLKGRQGVVIYINGKPSQMSGRDLAAFLKGLTANDIEAIEIISNPGAKFDAAGNAGIINIKLKKNKKIGTNGNVSVGFSQGITPKYDGSLSLNYRDQKWNLFSNYSYNYGLWNNRLNLDNTIGDSLYIQRSSNNWGNNDHNLKIGADYTINSKNTIGFIINGGFAKPISNSSSRTDISRISRRQTDSILVATTESANENKNINYNLNYRFADTSGRELNVDADMSQFRNRGTSSLPNRYRDAADTRTLTERIYWNTQPVDINIKSLKADFETPLPIGSGQVRKKAGKLGLGFKTSNVETDNTFGFYNVNPKDDSRTIDVNRSNSFNYKENINAGYVNYNVQVKKFTAQLGFRGEQTKSKGTLTAMKPTNSKDVDTTYFNVFPTAALGYTFSDKHAMNFTYRYSIDRPAYADLNPFESQIDELTFQKGNPFIRPMFTNTVEMGYTFMQAATLSVNYARTNDYFTQITDQEELVVNGAKTTRFFITNKNLAVKDQYGVSINSPLPINKWWNGMVNIWVNHSKVKADLGGDRQINVAATGVGFWMQHTFDLGKSWSAEVSGWGNAGGLQGNFVNKSQAVMDIGVAKKLWDGDGTLKLSIGDVFKTSRWAAYTDLGKLHMDMSGTWEGQRASVNFSYRFGNKNVKGARDRKSGLEDEKNRVKSGKG